MKPYKNRSGNSGVKAYESGPGFIKVLFAEGTVYVYSYVIPGKTHVDRMQSLADKGKGLSTYIAQKVKEHYEHKYKLAP